MPQRTPFTCEQLLELDETNREYLSEFAAVLGAFTGCTSPAEALIINLVSRQADDDSCGITPESLKHATEEFATDFELGNSLLRDISRRASRKVW